jgi:hypothetical protein
VVALDLFPGAFPTPIFTEPTVPTGAC